MMIFSSGYDFFYALEELGYASEAEARAVAPKVWARFGRAFLESYDRGGERAMHGTPWAEKQFGGALTPLGVPPLNGTGKPADAR